MRVAMGTAEAGTGRARCLALGRCVRPPGCGTGSDGKGARSGFNFSVEFRRNFGVFLFSLVIGKRNFGIFRHFSFSNLKI